MMLDKTLQPVGNIEYTVKAVNLWVLSETEQ